MRSIVAVTMIEGTAIAKLSSRAMEKYQENLEQIRKELHAYASPLCQAVGETLLPPAAISIPRSIKTSMGCEKGCLHKIWKMGSHSSRECCTNEGAVGEPPRLRIVSDLRAWNANTYKKSSPLPDMDGILRRAA